jgi:hypothetical protein
MKFGHISFLRAFGSSAATPQGNPSEFFRHRPC